MKYLILAAALAASPAFACGDQPCEPPVEPVPPSAPPAHEPPVNPPVKDYGPRDGSDSIVTPYVRQYFAVCSCDKFRVAWGFETREFREMAAREQCEVIRKRRECEK